MTSWPWMKNIDVAISEPIPPVADEDVRPSVFDLIGEHRSLIDEMKSELIHDPLFDCNKHDDLWILRFLLSHKKNINKALKAAKGTLVFRKEHNLDERDIRMMFPSQESNSAVGRLLEYYDDDAVIMTVPDPRRGVVFFLRPAGFNGPLVVKNVSEEHWLPGFTYMSEWTFQWLDYVTRTTGRLTKTVRIGDLKGMSISSLSREHAKRDATAQGVMQDFYPQALEKMYFINPPSWTNMIWKILKPMLPTRVISKIDFSSAKSAQKGMLQHISIDNLPERFGGQFKMWPPVYGTMDQIAANQNVQEVSLLGVDGETDEFEAGTKKNINECETTTYETEPEEDSVEIA